jgi:general secretion pathway protein C
VILVRLALLAVGGLLPLLADAEPPSPSPPPDLQAVGVVLSGNPLRSVAILRSAGRTRLAAVGETAFGGKLALVGRDSVVLDFGGRKVELRLTPGVTHAEALRSPHPAAAPAPPRPEPAPPGGRTLDRSEVERRLALEVPRILAETTAVPVMDEGRVAGLALTRVPEGSLLTDAGLQAGDVLTEVNGTAIDGLATLMALYPRLQGATELQAVVLRNGQPLRLSVSLR